MIGEIFYNPVKAFFNKIGVRLNALGVEPIHLTLIGMAISIIGAVLYALGHFISGSFVILFASFFDMLDGSLARSSKKETDFGAFIDSVIDRYSEFFIFGGLVVYYTNEYEVGLVILTLFALLGSITTSYAKARAENFIKNCSVGLMGRPERIFIICFGGFFGLMVPALWFMAILNNVTGIQRILYMHKQSEQSNHMTGL